MNSSEIKNILRNPYNREDWKNLYRNIFQGKVTFFEEPYKYDIKEEIVESLLQIGYVTLDDEYIIALFEVNIKSNVNVLSKKIGLRKIISKYISEDKFNGVLTIFENGSDDYRFTFASKTSKVTEEGVFVSETSSKRFTYILGKNEPCITPTQRFESLLRKNGSIKIDDVVDAFSVEKLNKEFFNGYKEHYELLCNYFYQFNEKKQIFQDDEKLIRDFVKKFLGRIVFLYFVQKKGWLGVKEGNVWGTGDHQFLSNIFKSFNDKSHFYSKIISKIFFNFLSVERKNDIVKLDGDIITRIPYLNGGLFEKESIDENVLDFNEQDLQSLFEFFDKFNFTIYEDDPNEQTVAVDPEMLGHIFENLLEDNKDKGAFYTPKEIVHYMCQESLIEYLTNWFKNKGYKIDGYSKFDKPNEQILFPENEGRLGQLVLEKSKNENSKIIGRKLIEDLLKKRLNEDDRNLVLEHSQEFNQALDDVKICDPAIGSGAFPMGLLQEIMLTKQILWNFEYGNLNNFPSSKLKHNIIENSIYGVDIEKGAVEIARLRFWLSIIVEEDIPQSLPNLDYKIVVGNSLVSKFDNEVISIDWDIKFKNIDSVKNLILEQQKNLYQLEHFHHLYFNTYSKKENLKRSIEILKIEILKNQINLNKIYFSGNNPVVGGFIPTQKEIEINNNNLNHLNRLDELILKLENLKNSNEIILDYFDWRLTFPEILNNKISSNSGFDIVIGNPPYIGEKGNKETFSEIKKGFLGKYYMGKVDIFYFFFHLGIDLLKKDGFLSFITTNYFLTADGAKILRKEFRDKTQITHLVNFNELKVFASAKGQHNIITCLSKTTSNRDCYVSISNLKNGGNSNELKKFLNNISDNMFSYTIPSNDLFEGNLNYIRLKTKNLSSKSDLEVDSVLTKLTEKSELLGELCYVNIGMRTGADKVSPKHLEEYKLESNKGDGIYVLSSSEISKLNLNPKEKELLVPFFKNSDIKKYLVKEKNNLYLLKTVFPDLNGLDSNKYPNIFNHLLKFKKVLLNRKSNDNGLLSVIKQGHWWAYTLRQLDFSSPKIVSPQRSMSNTFGYTEVEWYASMDVYFITKKNPKVNLKYILALLNSKLYYHWLYNKGKRKGNSLELYQTPLSEVPIKVIPSEKQLFFVKIIDEILSGNISPEYGSLQIDKLVYRLFDLTYSEVKSIDKDFTMSDFEYNKLIIE